MYTPPPPRHLWRKSGADSLRALGLDHSFQNIEHRVAKTAQRFAETERLIESARARIERGLRQAKATLAEIEATQR